DIRATDEAPPGYYKRVADFIAQLADGLQAAHDAGVIHRDVKPSNILITVDDTPKLTDFGLARVKDDSFLSQDGDFAGTYYYMSPEQVTAKRMGLDARTDIFSLGIVFYEMLTLRRPFEGDTSQQIAAEIITHDPPLSSVVRSQCPRELATIANKALEKDPKSRYQSMAEFAADLRRHLENKPILAQPPSLLQKAAKWVKRNPAVSVGVSITAVAMVLVLWLLNEAYFAKADAQASNQRTKVANSKLADALVEKEKANVSLENAFSTLNMERDKSAHTVYRLALARVQKALEESDYVTARSMLNDCPEDLRGWEWRHLELTSNRAVHRIAAHDGPVTYIKFDPLGRWLLSASNNGTVAIWDHQSGSLIHRTSRQVGLTAILDRKGERVVLLDLLGRVSLLDTRTWKTNRSTLRLPRGGFSTALAFNRDDSMLAAGGRGWLRAIDLINMNVLSSWDLEEGGNDLPFAWDERNALAVAFAGDEQKVFSFTTYFGAYEWETTTAHEPRLIGEDLAETFPFISMLSGVKPIVSFAEKNWVAFGSNESRVTIWDLEQNQEIYSLALTLDGENDDDEVLNLALNPSETLLAAFNQSSNMVYVWDLESGEDLSWSRASGLDSFDSRDVGAPLEFFPDGQRLLVAHGLELDVIDALMGEKLERLSGHSHGILTASVSPDESFLASGDSSGTVQIWKVSEANSVQEYVLPGDSLDTDQGLFRHSAHVISPFAVRARGAFGMYESNLYPLDSDGDKEFSSNFGIRKGNRREVVFLGPEGSTDLERLEYRTDGTLRVGLIPVNETGTVEFPELVVPQSGNSTSQGQIGDISGNSLAVGSFSIQPYLYDLETKDRRRLRFDLNGTTAIKFNQGGSFLAIGDRDGNLVLVNGTSGELVRKFSTQKKGIDELVFSPNGELLISASGNALRFWDLETGEYVERTTSAKDEIQSIAFNSDGQRMVTTGSEGRVNIWNPTTKDLLVSFKLEGVEDAIFDSTSDRLYAICDDTLTIWESNLDQAREDAKFVAGHKQLAAMIDEDTSLQSVLDKIDASDSLEAEVREAMRITARSMLVDE
ncbi:MAG: WD40 repeat protein, partial [Planctomycetota bacterium]